MYNLQLLQAQKSDNGYFMIFNGYELWTAYKPSNKDGESKKLLNRVFEKYGLKDKAEVIKWNII